MRILAIDTSTNICSVALLSDNKTYTCFKKCQYEHAQYILPLIKDILNRGTIELIELDALAFSRGPGSFTGIRIGVGIAQGLALGAKLPMISVSTLATMAQGAWRNSGSERILTVIDSRVEEVYWAKYIRNQQGIWHGEESEALLATKMMKNQLKQLSGKWTVVGTGQKILQKVANEFDVKLQYSDAVLPMAEDILPIARQLFMMKKTLIVEQAEPVYLRNTVI